MWTLSLLTPLALQLAHDPRTAPTLVEHTLFTLRCTPGRVESLGDVDGDGVSELLAQAGGDLVRFAGGHGGQQCTLAERPTCWAVGPDLDGDGIQDVAVVTEGSPAIVVVSGRTGDWLRVLASVVPQLTSLAWCRDLDGDGVPELISISPSLVQSSITSSAIVAQARAHSGSSGAQIWETRVALNRHTGARVQDVGDRTGEGVADILIDDGPVEGSRATWLSGCSGERFSDPLGRDGPFTALGDLDGDGRGDIGSGGAPRPFERFAVHASTGLHPWAGTPFPDQWPIEPVVLVLGDLDGDDCPEIALGDSNFHLRDSRQCHRYPTDLSQMTLQEAADLESRPMSLAQESGIVRVHSGATGTVILAIYGAPGSHWGLGSNVWQVADQDGDGLPDLAVNTPAGMGIFATGAARR